MKTKSPLLLLWLILRLAPGLAAQQSVGNPHGELPDGLTCTSCHTTEAWSPLRDDVAFDHGSTGFALDGRHEDATCARCHAGLVFDRIDTGLDDCGTCHVDVHLGTMTRSCSACHSTESFSTLDYGIVHPSDFPLEGAHLQTSCESCHVDDLGGAFRALDRECATCHMGDYVASTLVDHPQLGFSTDCTECHSTLDFRDVVFDHFLVSNGFELVGRHAGIECTTCHSGPGGEVTTTPAGSGDCIACHLSDYQGEHAGSDFPTDCLACHSPFEWDGANFDHTFPLFAGRHASEWNDCRDCHTTPGDLTVFSCFECHARPEMDSKHREEAGYVSDSVTCLVCHPDGRS